MKGHILCFFPHGNRPFVYEIVPSTYYFWLYAKIRNSPELKTCRLYNILYYNYILL